jgi:hypothetical protein
MTALFVAIVLAVFAGGVCLWLSGMFFGRKPRTDVSRLEEAESRAKRAEATKARAEEEVGRAATELGRVAGEMGKAEEEIARLKQEVEGLQLAAKHRLKPPPLPTKAEAGEKRAEEPESADLDFALAQLDMERVAHKKTRDELEQVKRGAPVQISDGRSSAPPEAPAFNAPGRRGAGYQTVSIASRGQPVSPSDHDRLRQSNDQLQREKERIETELARAQQELQLLKMRRE